MDDIFLLKKELIIEKKLVFLKDKTLTHNIHKFCSLFLMKTPNLQTKITSQNCNRAKQSYNLYKIAKLQKIKYKNTIF